MKLELLAHLPPAVRRALYFSLQQAIGSDIRGVWRELSEWEAFSPPQLEAAVESRLGQLLEGARKNSAYYRGLKIPARGSRRAQDWLRDFPILSRENLAEQFSEIVVDELRSSIGSPLASPPRGYGWVVVKTGGTTGTPTAVVHDAQFRDWGRALRLYASKLCGFPLGTPYFRLWGSEEDLLNQEGSRIQRGMRALLGEVPMNAFRSGREDLVRHYQRMRRHPGIHHMMAYADAAGVLAEFVEEEKLPAQPLRSIMGCAGNVTPELRAVLKRVFQAEVFDKYGSRECAEIACECSRHSGLHVFSPNIFLEILDEAGQPVPAGVCGQITITLLHNLTFPMIRFRIGDLGVMSAGDPCSCGLAWPRLERLEGRMDDLLTNEDGKGVTSVLVRHLVGVSTNRQLIKEWQLEQFSPKLCIFRYVPLSENGLEQNLKSLVVGLKKGLGESMTIQLERVDHIPLAKTGKRRWILNQNSRPGLK